MRVALRDGELVLTRRDGRTETLCRAAEIRRVVHIDGADARWIIGTTSTAWELPDDGWSPGWLGGTTSDRNDKQRSEVEQIAEIVGVRPKYAGYKVGPTPAGRGVRVVRLEPRARRPWALHALSMLSVTLWVVGWLLSYFDTALARQIGTAPLRFLGALLFFLPICWLVFTGCIAARGLHVVHRLREPPMVPAGVLLRAVPAGPASQAFAANAWLVVSAAEVVVRNAFGVEAWLAGPRGGGIRTAVLTGASGAPDRQLRLVRGNGQAHVALPVADWAGTPTALEAFRETLRSSGIDVVERPEVQPVPVNQGLVAFPDNTRIMHLDRPSLTTSFDVYCPAALSLLAEVALLRSGGLNVWSAVGAAPLLAVAAARGWTRRPTAPHLRAAAGSTALHPVAAPTSVRVNGRSTPGTPGSRRRNSRGRQQ